MTDHRDPELGRRLEDLRVPAHRSGFWADLHAELTNPTDGRPHGGPDLVEFDRSPGRRRRSRGPQLLAVAAALVLVALVAVGVITSTGGERETDVATQPSAPDAPTTTEASGPLRPEGEPIERGIGRPIAVDPSGTFLYVAAPAPDGGSGCEGAPAEALYVELVDGTGERLPASLEAPIDATGGVEMRFGPEGTVAVHTRCEGFGSSIVTGDLAENGEITQTEELTISDLDLGRPVDGITDLEFLAPGVLVASTYSVDEGGGEHRHLYSFPTSPSELSDLGQDGAIEVEVTDDGRLVVLTADGRLLVDGDVRVSGIEPGAVMSVGHGRIAVATSNRTDLYEVDPGEETDVRSSPAGGWDARVVSRSTVVVTRLDGERASVVALQPGVADEPTTLVPGAAAGMAIAPDASVVFAAIASSDPEAPPRLVAQRLTR